MEQIVEETQETVTTPGPVVHKTTVVTPHPGIKTEHPQVAYNKKHAIFRAYQIIWYILGLIEVLLGFRMALKALAANPASGFASLIYTLSDPLALPFQGILRTTVTNGSIFEWSTIIAALVYALIAYGIIYMMQMVKPVGPEEVETTVDNP
jgi:uncharacterized protein YggT (Ycf19 family)